MKSDREKIQFLYSLTGRINEIAVVADRKGCGEVGQLILDALDVVAREIGLPPDYKRMADEWRLANEGLEELMDQYPEGE